MGKKVAGTVYIKADGTQFTVTGGAEAPLSDKKRESVAPGYFKEEDLVPYVAVTVVDDPDLPIAQIMAATDATVTVDFGNGRTYVLSGGYVVDEPAAKGDDGTIDLKWEGTKGVWQ
ncbi:MULTISPECIES: phage tail tube protein [Pseudomonas]|uniref:phage tail tube protein n=1 Tax=Pseudomonas guariconensis TaxID=1288410 RepID=UPI00209835E1|nr:MULTISPECIES: phage tail tube protein [Pseudomonas]MCO7594272.1 phage tail tube protein [Pseudomonas guariconensis]MCU7220001.1 phage tail tube protein [Pseudomonas brassicacearum]